MRPSITATLYTDPGCPWAYSALPALRALDWRYGEGLEWRLVLIGLTERAEQYEERGYTPLRSARGQTTFRRFGMPFSPSPKARVSATAPACRAVVAVRHLQPGAEWHALRALSLAQFTTRLLLDDADGVSAVAAVAAGLDQAAVREAIDDDAVIEAYEADRAEARTAAGTPAELQEKTARTDGPVRFTAPSLVLERGGDRLVAGGWQSLDAYDVLVANLDPAIARRQPPDDAAELVAVYPEGLVTQEAAVVMARGNDTPDRAAAELALLEAVGDRRAERIPAGDDALWTAPGSTALRSALEAAAAAARRVPAPA